jgi:hypothetical protein
VYPFPSLINCPYASVNHGDGMVCLVLVTHVGSHFNLSTPLAQHLDYRYSLTEITNMSCTLIERKRPHDQQVMKTTNILAMKTCRIRSQESQIKQGEKQNRNQRCLFYQTLAKFTFSKLSSDYILHNLTLLTISMTMTSTGADTNKDLLILFSDG